MYALLPNEPVRSTSKWWCSSQCPNLSMSNRWPCSIPFNNTKVETATCNWTMMTLRTLLCWTYLQPTTSVRVTNNNLKMIPMKRRLRFPMFGSMKASLRERKIPHLWRILSPAAIRRSTHINLKLKSTGVTAWSNLTLTLWLNNISIPLARITVTAS